VSILLKSLKRSSFIVFTVPRRCYLLKYCSVGEPRHWKSTRFIRRIIFTGGFVMCAFTIFVEHYSFRGTWLDRFMLQPTVMPDYIVSNFKSFCKVRK